jgi:hypothetical protein
MVIEEIRIRALSTSARPTLRAELVRNLLVGEFVFLPWLSAPYMCGWEWSGNGQAHGQPFIPLMPGDILVKGIHEEIAVAGADGTVAARDILFGEGRSQGDGEANGAAVAVSLVGGGLGRLFGGGLGGFFGGCHGG